MPNIILKNSDGRKAYRFFYSAKEGICYGREDWEGGDYEILAPAALNDFDACIDQNDAIHLVCKEKSQDVLYYTYFKEQWYKRIILAAQKETSSRVEGFKVVKCGCVLNIFYILRYDRKKLLIHQTIGGASAGEDENTPAVAGILGGRDTSFSITTDMLNNITLHYRSAEDNNTQGSRRYMQALREWSRFEPAKSFATPSAPKSVNEEAKEWYGQLAAQPLVNPAPENTVSEVTPLNEAPLPPSKKKSKPRTPKQDNIKQLEQKIDLLNREINGLKHRTRRQAQIGRASCRERV